ncbi:MAG: TonB-dependent receptor [Acidobacteriaceae bacterium]
MSFDFRRLSRILAISAPIVVMVATINAQTLAGSVTGQVTDPQGNAIPGAIVSIQNPVSGLNHATKSDATGNFSFENVPFGSYHVAITAAGFASTTADVDLRSAVPVVLKPQLALSGVATTVNVTAGAEDIVTNTPTAHTDLDASAISQIPYQNTNAAVSSLLTLATPGIAQDSDGIIHAQGEHQDVQFSVDGQPITDQQSRQFSNQIALSSIDSMNVISGVPPAEYGDKASLVVQTTTKSGLSQKLHGNIYGGYGSFGTGSGGGSLGIGSSRYGTFTSIDVVNSGRFLDTPEFRPMNDRGNVENIFERLDWNPNQNNTVHLDLSASRSWAQTPNQYDQQALGQDQRNEIKSFNTSAFWTHIFNPSALLSSNVYVRQDQVHYYPSANLFADQPATLQQARRLTNFGIKEDFTYSKGIQNLKAGVNIYQTPLAEDFRLGITDPAYNSPCLNASGAPVTDPSDLHCTGVGETPNPGFLPSLLPYDLSRGGALFHFNGTTDIKQEAVYVEDELHFRGWLLSGGVRADNYNGISSRSMVEPRAGASYRIRKTNTVLRGSYGKFFMTPYNENLILSSSTGAGGLAQNVFGAYGDTALKPGKRNQFSTGFEQAIGSKIAVQGDYFWKFTDRDYDFDVLFNTPLSFPIQWSKSKIDGYAIRANLTPIHGISAYSVLGHSRSRFFGPEVGGLLFNNPNTPLSGAPFRIDHDQAFQQTTHLQYQKTTGRGPLLGFNWTYESGLVAGAVPFSPTADPNSPDFQVNLTGLTPDQQAQIDLTCGSQRATLANPLTSCPGNQLSSPLVTIPAPGTENDDKNPPRVQPRNTFDALGGYDNLFHREHYRVNASVSVVNLTNKYALYNFLSTFSGTHFVSPRTYTGQLNFVF